MPPDPIAFLFSLERLGMKFGLEHIATLCDALGHPERSFSSILIAGTNGKGSVTAMVETALGAAGFRAARYTSPHLVRIEERFVIGGAEVTTAALSDAAARVETIVTGLHASGRLRTLPTFFECTTAVAFELFRRASVDIAVLEVGLGGRLDATNIVAPVAAAITSIDFDHQAQLGDSLGSIAREKAGIVKPGIPVVCGPLPPEADEVVAEVCTARRARLIRACERVRLAEADDKAGALDVATDDRRIDGVRLALRGAHQRNNAAVAVALLEAIGPEGWPVDDRALRDGLERVVWPARIEIFASPGVEVLLDAAHNPAGARALAAWLREAGWSGFTLVFGAMRDKDVEGILAPLLPLASRVICTTPPNPRAVPAPDLAMRVAGVAGHTAAVESVPDPRSAIDRARLPGGRVVAAGSIFLIGPLRDILR